MSYLDAARHLLILLAVWLLGTSPGEPGPHGQHQLTRDQREGSIMGYGKQTIQLDFPELSESESPEDLIFVRMLNPRLCSQEKLAGSRDLEVVDGKPVDKEAAKQNSYEIIAGLVRAWHVYDPDDDSDDPVRFPTPATPEMVAKLPMAIMTRLMKTVNEAIDPK